MRCCFSVCIPFVTDNANRRNYNRSWSTLGSYRSSESPAVNIIVCVVSKPFVELDNPYFYFPWFVGVLVVLLVEM